LLVFFSNLLGDVNLALEQRCGENKYSCIAR